MRTLTANQTNMLSMSQYSSHVDVQVYNTTTAAWVSLRTLLGKNFVRTVTWTDNVDSNGATATITLDRNIYFLNLASLVQTFQVYGTYGTLIDINVPIKIFSAVMPPSTAPQSQDWMEVFYGRIYQTDWSTNEMQLQCADWLGQLQSTWIENSYGVILPTPGLGEASQSIMQQLLNTVAAYSGVSLVLPTVYSVNGTGSTPFLTGVSPDDPGWAIASTTAYPTSLMTVYTSIDNIAQQIGWMLRQKWNNNIGTWALTFFDPLRTSTTSVWTFSPSTVLDATTCGVHLGDIRNVVQLWYYNGGSAGGNNIATCATMPSATYPNSVATASIAKYGRQFMQLGTDSTVGIVGNTLSSTGLTDFQTMLGASISDLANPLLDYVVDVPFFYPVELNDIYTFPPDNYHFSASQQIACIGYTHTVDAQSQGTTSLQMRGAPSGGITRWLSKQQQFFTKSLGVVNTDGSAPTDLHPNSNLGQYTRF